MNLEYARHFMAIDTHDVAIQQYWNDVHVNNEYGFVPFRLEGAICWEPEGDVVRSRSLELINGYYNPYGKHILHNPVQYHRQTELSRYEINGKLLRTMPTNDPQEAKQAIGEGVDDIAFIAGLLSFDLLTGVEWYPARYLRVRIRNVSPPEQHEEKDGEIVHRFYRMPRLPGEHSSALARSKELENVLALYDELKKDEYKNLFDPLLGALTWLRTGLLQTSYVNRFLNLFLAIEGLALDLVSRNRNRVNVARPFE